jgi:hypothetical protein
MAKGVFSLVTMLCDVVGLDLNRAYSSSPAMRRGPMEFGGPSLGDGSVTQGMFIHIDGSNGAAPDVFDKMTCGQYDPGEVHMSSFFVLPSL